MKDVTTSLKQVPQQIDVFGSHIKDTLKDILTDPGTTQTQHTMGVLGPSHQPEKETLKQSHTKQTDKTN